MFRLAGLGAGEMVRGWRVGERGKGLDGGCYEEWQDAERERELRRGIHHYSIEVGLVASMKGISD